ncbi:hypothetical protein N0V90_002082 [Kalmusia sp. IMI 367209]|nr:hypothetical protein N0V90_002082 [Kalmusia sp. IMI 367209]
MYPLSYLEHTRAVRPSTLLEVYLTFTLLLDIPQARTLFLRKDVDSIAILYSMNIAAMLTLCLLESQNKTKDLKEPYNEYPPEATRGVWNRTFFLWLNPLFTMGFKRLLSLDDLWENPSRSVFQEITGRNAVILGSTSIKVNLNIAMPLIWACVKCLRWPLLSVIPARICLIGLNYTQPFLISRMIDFVSDTRQSKEYYSHSLGLIAAAALIYVGVAVFTARYMHALYRSITMLRGGLVGLIFNKALILRDGVYDDSAAITHMSTDIDRIASSMQSMHEVWSRLIEVAIGVWLLSIQLGAICVIPIVVVISKSINPLQVLTDNPCVDNPSVCAGINTYASKFASEKQKVWSRAVQTRIGSTASMLGAMKSVKMMGLADPLFKNIQNQRAEEMKSANGYRWLVLLTNMTGYTPQIFAPVLTFVAYQIRAHVSGSDHLSTNQAITSLATITLLTAPASTLLTAIPETSAAIGCFQRIQKFLAAASQEDYRQQTMKGAQRSEHPFQPPTTSSIELQSISVDKRRTDLRTSTQVIDPAIMVRSMTVRPSPTAEAAIKNINLQLQPASMTIVTGPVGSGKSTLIKALLGELSLQEGSISISSTDIAYCSQNPWILNTTIQRNICGLTSATETHEEWYQTVLHACALDQDLQQWANGDQSIPGSRGTTLSGGQKQRIALARTVYARPSIVLLDDVLSALDSRTEAIVVDRLMGPHGLFRIMNATVLLVTHSTRHFHHADHVVVLDSDGKIAQQGSFYELRDQEGSLSDLILRHDTGTPEANPAGKAAQKKKKHAIKGATATDVADITRKTGDVTVYKYYFRSISMLGTVCFLGSTALFVFTQFFPQIWLVWWIEAHGHQTAKYMSVYIIFAVASWSFRAGTLWCILLWISPRSSIKLHQILLNTAVKAPQSFFASTDIGVTLNRFSQDIGLIDRILPLACGRVVLATFTILAQAALIAQGSSYMAIAIPVLVIAFYGLQKVYLLTSRQLRFLDLEARSPIYTHFLECSEGLSTIRAFGWSNDVQAIQIDRLDKSQRPYYLLYCLQRWLSLVLDLMVAAVGIVVVALATRAPGQSSGVAVGIALNNVLGFSQSLRVLVESWTQLETSLGAIARLKSFEQTVIPEDRPEERDEPPASWPDKGKIEFKNVTASYAPSAPALHDISMVIAPGQKVGVCGRTGSGKSSILMTLFRLIELEGGSIEVDGLNISTLPREIIRARLIAIPQDPFLLSLSVRQNADPSDSIDDEAIIVALEKVQLWSILQSRGGLDAQMKTQPLSQGQQQLFCLARAMLRSSKILVLDEATSNVDAETDALMQRIIRKEFSQHTIITVAHRLNTIRDSDVVAVLDNGRLAEFGPPTELLARENSLFNELHSR